MNLILLFLLIILIVAVVPHHGYSRSWGYGPSGFLMIILVVLLILFLLGKL